MTIVVLFAAIALLLMLITLVRLNPFLSLIIAALFVGIANHMALQKVVTSLTNGIGSTLGSLVMVLGFGVMLGGLLTETGAAQKISEELIRLFGARKAKLAMMVTGFFVGIALFYNAGFIVLIPLVFSVAVSVGQPLVYLTIAMASALSVTHGFLPPHPGPTAIAIIFKADIGKTLLYGLIVAIPALILAGLVFPQFIKHIPAAPPQGMFTAKPPAAGGMPGFGVSLLTAMVPVLLMALATLTDLFIHTDSTLLRVIHFVGDPGIAMLVAVLAAVVLLGVVRGISVKSLMDRTTGSFNAVSMIILVTAAGGAFKQVLIDSGTGNAISAYFVNSSMSPLLLGWLIATFIRIAIGSATVAGLTAAGIVKPLIATMHVQPELMVISIGAGSLMCSHVNDTGFWMFKEYLGISVADTFRSWTVMETIVGVVGLAGVLLLSLVV